MRGEGHSWDVLACICTNEAKQGNYMYMYMYN